MTTTILRYILRVSQHFTHKIFGIMLGARSDHWLSYGSMIKLTKLFGQKIESLSTIEDIRIAIVTSNTFLKTIAFLYCFFTNTKLILISPKFSINEIVSKLLSIRNIDVLIIDTSILVSIKQIENEEDINIRKRFKIILYSQQLSEELYLKLDEIKDEETNEYKLLRSLIHQAKMKILTAKENYFTFVSPGSATIPSLINISTQTFAETAIRIKQFFGFKPNTTISIVADFELHPILFTILGFITSVKYVNVSENIDSVEEFKTNLKRNKIRINTLFIASHQFIKIWDYILNKVFSNKIWLFLYKYRITRFVTNWVILKELRLTLPNIERVHILNEELGVFVLKYLAKSKIIFTSSYGFLEQGNFLAFKDPILFKDKKYCFKPGGTLLKSSQYTGNIPTISDDNHIILESANTTIVPGDIGSFIKNIKSQGDRKYFLFHDRDSRGADLNLPSLHMIEKMMKDDIIIKDCFIVRQYCIDKYVYSFYIEVREELLDLHKISYEEVIKSVKKVLQEIIKSLNVSMQGYGIINLANAKTISGYTKIYVK